MSIRRSGNMLRLGKYIEGQKSEIAKLKAGLDRVKTHNVALATAVHEQAHEIAKLKALLREADKHVIWMRDKDLKDKISKALENDDE